MNSPFFAPHIWAEARRAKRESRITSMRMLRTNQWKIIRPSSIRVHTTVLASVPFSARALTLILKTNWNVVYRGLYSYWQQVRVITLFLNIFSYCLCMLSEFAKAFERKVWRVQVAHLHNAARALSSPSRCFQLSTNLDKDFFRYLWYCGKKQIKCRLAWHWWNSTDLGLIDMFFLPIRMQKLLPVYCYSENRATSRIWKVFPNMVFPPIGGEN